MRFQRVAKEAKALAAQGLTPDEIAAKVGASRASVFRWFRAGLLTRSTPPAPAPDPPSSPALPASEPLLTGNCFPIVEPVWADVRANYALDTAAEATLRMAERAWRVAMDRTVPRPLRQTHSEGFLKHVTRLDLAKRTRLSVPRPPMPARRYDPRILLNPAHADYQAAMAESVARSAFALTRKRDGSDRD